MEGAKLFDLPRVQLSERYEILKLGGGGTPSTAVCGVFQFDHPAAHQLVALLPKVLAVEAWNSPHMEWIQSTLRMMAAEARELRPGGETVITRLADILVIHAIRSWIAQDPAAQTGWLAGARDPGIGQALALMHAEPASQWTIANLARRTGMSRTRLAERFHYFLDDSPMAYLTKWRLKLGAEMLTSGEESVAQVAATVGYGSEATFNRAFKREYGLPPAKYRRQR